jgi:hypothetical protein
MKLIKIITHPITLSISFLIIIISGQHLGGFYLLYILLGLPHGSIHSIFGAVGVATLLFSSYKYRGKFNYLIEPCFNIAGVILLSLSLFLFFYNDKDHYNYGTFYQTVPLASLILFALLSISFSITNIFKLFRQVAT